MTIPPWTIYIIGQMPCVTDGITNSAFTATTTANRLLAGRWKVCAPAGTSRLRPELSDTDMDRSTAGTRKKLFQNLF